MASSNLLRNGQNRFEPSLVVTTSRTETVPIGFLQQLQQQISKISNNYNMVFHGRPKGTRALGTRLGFFSVAKCNILGATCLATIKKCILNVMFLYDEGLSLESLDE